MNVQETRERRAETDSRPVKRRGLIAGAAAMVAGIAAAKAAQPVGASSGGGTQGFLALGSNPWYIVPIGPANTAAISNAPTVIRASSDFGNYGNVPGADNVVFEADARTSLGGIISGIIAYAKQNGDGVFGNSDSGNGVLGNSLSGNGVSGTSTGGDGVSGTSTQGNGVSGTSTADNGVSGTSTFSAGVAGVSGHSFGGSFSGGRAPIRLNPASTTGAPSGAHSLGELYVDSAGALFYCTASGTPGTWVNLSSPATSGVSGITAPGGTATGAITLAAGNNVTITEAGNTITIAATTGGGGGPTGPTLVTLPTPERFVDTRANLGGLKGPVPGGTTHTFQMTGRNGQSGNAALQIPDSAKTLIGNLTVIGADGIPLGSFVTLWPGGTQPTVSNINYGPASVTGAVANTFVVGLGASGGHGVVSVFNLSRCDYILDVTGYYA